MDTPWPFGGIATYHVRRFPAGDLIFRPGDLLDSVYVVESGLVHLYFLDEEGSRRLLRFAYPNDLFGLTQTFLNRPAHLFAEAECDSCVGTLPLVALREYLAAHPETWERLLKYVLGLTSLYSNRQLLTASSNAQGRVCHALLLLSSPQVDLNGPGHHPPRTVHITHQELGDLSATNRVTVTRIINRLAMEGCIRKGRRSITVADPEALAARRSTVDHHS